jgi:hypothetical protein
MQQMLDWPGSIAAWHNTSSQHWLLSLALHYASF